jgi:hypothetical protein
MKIRKKLHHLIMNVQNGWLKLQHVHNLPLYPVPKVILMGADKFAQIANWRKKNWTYWMSQHSAGSWDTVQIITYLGCNRKLYSTIADAEPEPQRVASSWCDPVSAFFLFNNLIRHIEIEPGSRSETIIFAGLLKSQRTLPVCVKGITGYIR